MSLKEAETSPDWYKRANATFIKSAQNVFSKYHTDIQTAYPKTCGCDDCLKLIEPSETKDMYLIFDWLRTNVNPYVLTLSKDNPEKFSYGNKPEESYDYRKRKITTLRRFITRNTGLEVNENSIAKAENLMLEELKPIEWHFQEFRGEDILKAYTLQVGGRSCMTKDGGNYVRLYSQNECVSLLVGSTKKQATMKEMSEAVASMRCLLWDCGDTVAVDRIYRGGKASEYSIEEFREKIAAWVKAAHPEKTVVSRKHNDQHNEDNPAYDKKTIMEVTVNEPPDGIWPYLDSFRYGRLNKDKDKFILSTSAKDHKWYIVSDAGAGPRIGQEKCITCSRDFSPKDAGTRPNMCSRCVPQYMYDCSCCKVEFNSVIVPWNTVLIKGRPEKWCQTCSDDKVASCIQCGHFHLKSDVVKVKGRRSSYCRPCTTKLGFREADINAFVN